MADEPLETRVELHDRNSSESLSFVAFLSITHSVTNSRSTIPTSDLLL
jgi:hypothetical protein